MIHFLVHPGMAEVRALAQEHGWIAQGYNVLAIAWLELHFTTDAWATSHVLKSTDVPCPVVNGWYYLPNVQKGDIVEFAVQAGVTCHTGSEHASRDQASLWFNNDGKNYQQIAT